MKKAILLLMLVGASVYHAEGQRVKYKDLYFLLDTRKYDDAEPFLKKFLKEDKNVDHPNANFQMAVVYQEKTKKNDVLLETEVLTANIDSAIIFYRKALKYIDNKEVRRNDEYYQAYKRRDIRTGKFGIKLADVQFDIERKIESLQEQKSRVVEVKEHHQNMQESYTSATHLFDSIQTDYPTEKVFLLRADDHLLTRLGDLKKEYLAAVENFGKYKASSGRVSNSGYDQSLQQKEILNYAAVGQSEPDYQADNIEFWDFARWADQAASIIKEKVQPLQVQIIVYDKELNRLKNKLLEDSLSVIDDIPALTGQLLTTQLKEYDPEPLPVLIADLKETELYYRSYLLDNADYKDSLDIIYRMEVINTSLNKLNSMDSIVNLLIDKNLVEEVENYKKYVTTQFGNDEALQTFVKEKLDFAIEGVRLKEAELEDVIERSRWLIDENDSIPLFKVTSGLALSYTPLLLNERETAGLYFSGEEAAKGYFTLIEPSRVPQVNIKFDVDASYFNRENLENVFVSSIADESGHIYYLLFYAPKPEQDGYAAVVSKIYTSDGLAWSKKVDLSTTPAALLYEQSSGNCVIKYDPEAHSGTNGDAPASLVLDKKGNVVERAGGGK